TNTASRRATPIAWSARVQIFAFTSIRCASSVSSTLWRGRRFRRSTCRTPTRAERVDSTPLLRLSLPHLASGIRIGTPFRLGAADRFLEPPQGPNGPLHQVGADGVKG